MASDSTRELNSSDELNDALTALSRDESTDAPFLSVYLSLFPERLARRSTSTRMKSLLQPIRELADSGRLGHAGSMSLRGSVEKAIDMAPMMSVSLDAGMALFLGGDSRLEKVLRLPRRAWDCAVAGPTPYLRPLRAVLDELRKVAAVVLDGRRAEISVYFARTTLGHQVVEAEELRKSDLAGWYGLDEYRNRQHAEEARNRLFREVAERLERLRRDEGVELILIGGQSEITGAMLHFLDRRVRALTKVFNVDVHTLTPPLLAKTVATLEDDHERREEMRLVEDVYALSAAGDHGALGLDRVLTAANRNAVSQLLVDDGATLPGSLCNGCSALSRSVDVCPQCGGSTTEVPDLIESLVCSVAEAGGRVEHVMAETRLAEDVVAARLRFIVV